jgi:hypothetical protein
MRQLRPICGRISRVRQLVWNRGGELLSSPLAGGQAGSHSFSYLLITRTAMNTRHLLCLAVALVAVTASGCASIINGRTATVQIDSRPSEAQIVIRDKRGDTVLTTQTPATVELKRKDKFIWPAKYTATIEKPGFESKTVAIDQTVNPWIVGNVVFGGIIGLAVDNATGAAWKPKVASIREDLAPVAYASQQPGMPPQQQPVDDSSQWPPAQVAEQPSPPAVQPATAVY